MKFLRRVWRWFLNGLQLVFLIPVIIGLIFVAIGILLFTIVSDINYD